MSFREKTAWVTLVALLVVSAMYAHHVPDMFQPNRGAPRALFLSVIAFVVIELSAWLVLRLRNPVESRSKQDELERLISLKALRIAFHVYVVASFAAIFFTLHMRGAGPVALAMCIVIAYVGAQLTNCIARIVYFRRIA
jgi:archaellum biogenesis protein FlaJ (TadC family)